MARQNTYHQDGSFAGWFDTEQAVCYKEPTEWDSNNHIGVRSKDQYRMSNLYKTPNGTYVLESWSNWQGEMTKWEIITESEAEQWLIQCNMGNELSAEALSKLEL